VWSPGQAGSGALAGPMTMRRIGIELGEELIPGVVVDSLLLSGSPLVSGSPRNAG
jgi:hypothetical protein